MFSVDSTDEINRRIIVIDDNESIHQDFRKILLSDPRDDELDDDEAALFGEVCADRVRISYELSSAFQGQEGYEEICTARRQGRPYALAFVDMRMPPGWDGLETIEHIWNEDPDLQVVICTAYSDYSWSDMARRLGQGDRLLILKKPFDTCEVEQLAATLTQKWNLARQARLKSTEMEQAIRQRTTALAETNETLRREIEEHSQTAEELSTAKEQFAQAQKMEAIGVLAGGVAHEFNNLLQAIRGYCGFVLDELPSEGVAHQDVQQAIQACDQAAQLTSQLLLFSRRQSCDPINLDLNEVVESALAMLRPLVDESIDITTSLGGEAVFVHADCTMLQQVIMNLCINARDAMPEGGTLTITTEVDCADQPDAPAGQYARLSVSDTGSGISSEHIERVFEPFFTTRETGKGTGLGLSMVHGAVQQFGGTVRVESKPGQGAQFVICLPLAEAPEHQSALPPVDDETAGGDEVILLAEDEELVRDYAARLMTNAGYEVLQAGDGAEAVELFRHNADRIALAVLDVVMPAIHGHEVCRAIHEINPELPVLFCSAYDRDAAEAGFVQEKSFPVLKKPCSGREFLRTVRDALSMATRGHSAPVTV